MKHRNRFRAARGHGTDSALAHFAVCAAAALFSHAAVGATSCSVSASGLAFGLYDTINPVSNGAVTITVNCSAAQVSGALSASAGNSTNQSDRQMWYTDIHGVRQTLRYNLYTDAARTSVWGPTNTIPVALGSSKSATLTAYGLIPGNQNVAPGTYSDSITITLTY
ncbi:fimbrial major subunit CsuA/B family protein [Paraburkholderia sp. NMBU_R16]|uniref:Csu type fimbrial protein n=1 Tax=Paraburkholderia sp. NMBU_R16 TaxID=2698676 RepID=UPI00156407D0|nr:spore coat U domain-containing protein [Paraburkholderia sp. NMBU_R16]NRO99442.1 fimbrial major subunit CsuA/B family protein [Paraburkholderia sp. NMBU_R16]